MRSFTQYIKESIDTYRLNEVEATYIVQPEEIILQAPETFQESDIQQYMDDMWLPKLPSNSDYSEKFFGKNNDSNTNNYVQGYFQYDSKKSGDDVKLEYFKIKNLRYIISFDRFDMVGVDDDNVREKLIDVFKSCESSKENEWPIEIVFDEDSLEFRK